jgi:hypothetical protein
MKPINHCPLCQATLGQRRKDNSAVGKVLGGAGGLYDHFLKNCPCSRGQIRPHCPICGWPPHPHDLAWSMDFLVAMHWYLTQDLDEIDHILRSSMGEIFLPKEALR